MTKEEEEEEEVRKGEEELRKKEQEVKDLEHRLKVAHKRVREHQVEIAQKRARVASHSQEKRPTYSPTIETASTAHTYPGTGFDNPTASRSQTLVDCSLGYNSHAVPDNSAASTSSSEVHDSSDYHPIGETINNSSIGNFETLTYYTELDARINGKARSFNDMDLDQLSDLAAKEEDAEGNFEQISHVYYFIFLKTGAIEDLERAIHRAEGRIPPKIDNPDYVSRLKDLIVMLVKKYERTYSLDNLQEAIFRAQEMIAVTPLDHPDRLARMGDWINMMFKKFSRTKSQDDLDEAMIAIQEAGGIPM